MKNKYLVLYLFFFLFNLKLFSTDYHFKANDFIKIIDKSDVKLNYANELKFQLINDKAEEIFNSNFTQIEIQSFPISAKDFDDIIVNPVQSAFNEKTEWYAGTKDGLKRMPSPTLNSYQGKIKNQPNSYVFINYANGQLFSYIKNEDGYVYSIAPINDGSKDNEYILLSHNSSEQQRNFVCLTDNSKITTNEADDISNHKYDELLATNMLEIKVACEGTYDFYALMGSDFQKASAYIAAVLTQVSKIYQDNLNVNLLVSYVLIWQEESKDPYRATENLFDKLSLMPNLWYNKSVDRAITCLFADLSNQPANTTVAGIAYSGSPNFGTLCNKSLGYSVFGIRGNGKYPTMNYTWDVNCAAHEIGHNFSSPHTHNCDYFVPPIDTCITGTDPGGIYDACIQSGRAKPILGTIMSYCHLTNPSRSVDLNFHPRCITIMRKAVENAKCAYTSQSPKIFLVDPLGEKIYKANTDLKIRWRVSNVNNVNIKYSLDSGITWIELKNRVNASDNEIIWKLPNITVWNVLVLIENSDNISINDRSLKTFAIVAPAINLDNQLGGQKFGHRETINLSWTTYFVDNVRIEFSSDGGRNWNKVIDNVNGFTYKWTIPSINSNECLIRLISLPDESVITQSQIFAIGQQKAKIIKPNGGEILCANSTYEIEWFSEFVSTLFLEYSINNGLSWQRVTLGSFKPNTTTYSWAVPMKPSNQVLMRIYTKPDSVIYLDTSDYVFTIDTCLTDIDEKSNQNKSLDWVQIAHEKITNKLILKYKSNINVAPIELELYDLLGNKITNLIRIQSLNPGIYESEIDLLVISQGIYFILLKSNNEKKVFMLSITN
ncbi:MAG: zinc-dependent metalloprotease [Candidatus Kapabacteria bacterium]|nr:zinc-dependent metalloprotease [Candidatus Kapabacteria bacterium]